MNLLKLSFVVLLTILSSSCGDKVSKNCDLADWLGTYTGTLDCSGGTENVTVTILPSGLDGLEITYESPSLTSGYDHVVPGDCSFDYTTSGFGLTLDASGMLDGDIITFSDTLSDGSDGFMCSVTATRN